MTYQVHLVWVTFHGSVEALQREGLPQHLSLCFPKQRDMHLVKDSHRLPYSGVTLHEYFSRSGMSYLCSLTDVPINIGAVIGASMSKGRVHKKVCFRFNGRLTKLLRAEEVEEDPTNYKPQ